MNNNHFDLTLDTLGPTGSISLSERDINENKPLTITKNADAKFMKLWFNTSAIGTKDDDGYKSAKLVAAEVSAMTSFENDGVYYYHMVLMDDVGNESEKVYNTAVIAFDTTDPVITEITLPTITASKENIEYRIKFTDTGASQIDKLYVSYSREDESGEAVVVNLPVIEDPTSDTPYSFNFSEADPDAEYNVTAVLKDKAGNTSAPISAKIILNTAKGKLTLSLLNADEQSLSDFINYHDIKANIQCLDDASVVGYKIWESGTAEPESWTSREAGTDLNVTLPITLSANDGKKTINAKTINTAGTIIEAEAKSVTIDTIEPEISLTCDKTIISEISGYDKAIVTLTGSDDRSGIYSFKLVKGTSEGGTQLETGSTLDEPVTFELTKSSGTFGDDGNYDLTLFVYDNAGNKSSKTITVTLDTTAPAVELNDLAGTSAGWYNDIISNAKATFGDANNVSKVYVWVSTSDSVVRHPDSVDPVSPAPASPYSIPADDLRPTWSTTTQGSGNYLHIEVIDVVGNSGFDVKGFKFDNEAPSSLTANFEKSVYNATETAVLRINAADAQSGTAWMRVTGNIANPTASDTWEEYAESKTVSFTSAGQITVTVEVKDAAGNIREQTATATCEYDPINPFATLVLRDPSDTDGKESPTSLDEFVAHVSGTDDEGTGQASYYQLYGDFSATRGSAQGMEYDAESGWIELSYDSGKQYKTLTHLYLTAGDGPKNIYLMVKDNAGNISKEPAKVTIIYDTTAPTVNVSDIDYQRVSKLHELRRSDAETTIDGKYCDEMHFVFTPDSVIQAYKICAYLDREAAEAGSPNDPAIPQANDTVEGLTPKSINMHQNNLVSDTAVSCMISGADFEYALGGVKTDHSLDGVHIVVVYVQDLAGTWSEAAVFDASI